MRLAELKNKLNDHPGANLRFLLPDGDSVPAHAHITEVARVDKHFVDCGGTFRSESFCRLQTWFSGDLEHRLTAARLLKILEKAKSFLGADDLEVDIEHEAGFISQFPLASIETSQDEIVFHLAARHTACLAEDKCMRPSPPSELSPLKFDFREGQPSSGCCVERSSATP